MNNIKTMQVCDSTDNLLEVLAGLLLINFGIFNNIVKKFPIFNVLHNKEKMATSLDNLVKLYNGRMPYQLQYMYLPGYTLDICNIDYLLFHEYFYGNTLARQRMRA